jgi:parallel beta-helix repeat protein
MILVFLRLVVLSAVLSTQSGALAGPNDVDFSPRAEERQLPKKMHSSMEELPTITVGKEKADLTGSDNRVLQAAVDYLAGLGGGTVEIGPGEFIMHDSLHLRSFVTVRGTPGRTVLRKANGALSPLALDGDYGEEQITVTNPKGFEVGHGVAVWDSSAGGFHTTVARITGCSGNTFSIDRPLNADCMVSRGAKAATVFPVISGYDIEGVLIEHLVIDGDREHNVLLNGCRGAGIFLYRGFGTVINKCKVRNYNGDGISFQQSNDVTVSNCVCENNASLGIHPGSGSQRPTVRGCVARNNGEDGLFLCWRVRHGVFEENVTDANGRYGISIGHKDSDNLFRHNQVSGNQEDGVCFREETLGMAAHRNRLENNVIENNGLKGEVAGIRIRGQTNDIVLKNNLIRDTRPLEQRRQVVGIQIEEKAGSVTIEGNIIEAKMQIKDQRKVVAGK